MTQTQSLTLADTKNIIMGTKERFLSLVDEKVFLKEAGFAVQAFERNHRLMECDRESVKNAIMNIAMTGATLNPAKQQAFLIPRKLKSTDRRPTCCLDISYRGMIQIACDSGAVLDIDATVAHEGDYFYYEQGLNPVLKHIPKLEGDKGKLINVYAIATMTSGLKKFIVLDREEVEKIRLRSMQPTGDMWKNFYDEGARKTAVKKLYKMLPQSERLSQVIQVVNQQEGIEAFNDQSNIIRMPLPKDDADRGETNLNKADLDDESAVVVISPEQLKRYHAIASNHGWYPEEKKELLKVYEVESSSDIPVDLYEKIIGDLESKPLKKPVQKKDEKNKKA